MKRIYVIAPSATDFQKWCKANKKRYLGDLPEAIYVERVEQLYGLTTRTEEFVILGYPSGPLGDLLREKIDDLFWDQREM